jgi:hypothetical protein
MEHNVSGASSIALRSATLTLGPGLEAIDSGRERCGSEQEHDPGVHTEAVQPDFVEVT